MKVLCLVLNHRWQRVRYPGGDGYFVRCTRCGRERDEPYLGTGPAAGMGAGPGS